MDDSFRRVLATPAQYKFLIDHFKCSTSMVYHSLKFEKNGILARRIRSYAINTLKCPVI